ncbi:outer membrane protein assembly factor BamB family protein [Christensenella intestinihominis]|uniref:outer membrane protein assembly factor BamB family protein n=1 Tax=Christensenella intestinihominis TaxID=1851429 RepID=UPI001560906C|nr:PQQ-binding-like beta-propeller repeat protein [Christensenella intestinihominis]
MAHRFNRYHSYRPRRRHRGRLRIGRLVLLILIFAAIIFAVVLGVMFLTKTGFFAGKDPSPSTPAPAEITAGYEAPVQTAEESAAPAAVDTTQPAAFGLTSEIEQDGAAATDLSRTKTISFPVAGEYTPLAGIVTADGNHYRNTRSFGRFSAADHKLEKAWPREGGAPALAAQPLAVKWDDDMRQMMNLYPEKAAKAGLTEVLLPGTDGTLSFADLADGSATRDPISLGFTPGGALSLDPRGYPLVYIGGNAENACMGVYSLLTGELLYQYGGGKDSFSLLDGTGGFSCAPLVAADADALIWVGENGILYTMDLNSDFDRAAGTVSISPDEPVKYRYSVTGGAEGAAPASFAVTGLAAWRNYAFITDSGGYVQCVDFNTMKPVYIQKTGGGIASSPLVEEAADGIYLYIGCKAADGNASVYKIKGLSGEIIWQRDFPCGADGGIFSTPAPGKGSLGGMVFCTVAQGSGEHALVAALAADTGEIKWQQDMDFASAFTPAAAYSADGTGCLLAAGDGNAALLDGGSGEALGSLGGLDGTDSAPVILGNTAISGGMGITIK